MEKKLAESIIIPEGTGKKEKYDLLIPQLRELVRGEPDLIANTANVMAALKETFGFFWVGIYFVKKDNGNETLVLGPFQGPVACTRIQKGKGVCGTSWNEKRTVVVEDVGKFPGHIACSALSKSEIVVPVISKGEVTAVIDIDSDRFSAFDEIDALYLEEVARIISVCG